MIAYAAPRTAPAFAPNRVGQAGISFGDWHLVASLWSEPAPPCAKPLPFERAWFVRPSSPRRWARIQPNLACEVLHGWIRVDGAACEYGHWLVDIDLERAAVAGALADQRDLVEWDRRTVNLFTPASNHPLLELSWRLG